MKRTNGSIAIAISFMMACAAAVCPVGWAEAYAVTAEGSDIYTYKQAKAEEMFVIPGVSGSYEYGKYLIQIAHSCRGILIDDITFDIQGGIPCLMNLCEYEFYPPHWFDDETNYDKTPKLLYWNTKADGTGTIYRPGDKVEMRDLREIGTLYAIWDETQGQSNDEEESVAVVDPVDNTPGESVGDATTVPEKTVNDAKEISNDKKASDKAAKLKAASFINKVKVTKADIQKASKLGAKSVTLGKRVKKINKKAFKGSNIKTITIISKKLTKKSVRKSLKGSKVTRIKVNVGSKKANIKYIKKYRKIFAKKNAGKKVKITR